MKDGLHLVEQLARDDDFVLVRKKAVLLRASHAPVKRVFQDKLDVAAGNDVAIAAAKPESRYLVAHRRKRVVASSVKHEKTLDEVCSFRVEDNVLSQTLVHVESNV